MNITPHFTLAEFASRDHVPYPSEWVNGRLAPLCAMLELVRAEFSRPMVIISGYRSPVHNAEVNGAKNSQHCYGRAADVTIVNVDPADVHACVLELYEQGRLPMLGGLGKYSGWNHVDIRPQTPVGHLARWNG